MIKIKMTIQGYYAKTNFEIFYLYNDHHNYVRTDGSFRQGIYEPRRNFYNVYFKNNKKSKLLDRHDMMQINNNLHFLKDII